MREITNSSVVVPRIVAMQNVEKTRSSSIDQ